jgi:hypothetical protein
MNLEALTRQLASEQWGLYFHGTASAFDRFDEARIGTGKDANAGLGFFVTSEPGNATAYARMVAESGTVLVVLMRVSNPYEFDTFEGFYGADLPGADALHDRAYFEALRIKLIETGYDSAFFALDDDGLIGVSLASAGLVVLGELTPDEAEALSSQAPFASGGDPTNAKYKQDALAAICAAQSTTGVC